MCLQALLKDIELTHAYFKSLVSYVDTESNNMKYKKFKLAQKLI